MGRVGSFLGWWSEIEGRGVVLCCVVCVCGIRMEWGSVTGPDQLRDVPVAGHLAGRDLLHGAVNSVEEVFGLFATGHSCGRGRGGERVCDLVSVLSVVLWGLLGTACSAGKWKGRPQMSSLG